MRPILSFFLILASCADGPAPVAARPLRDFRGIIHCHSLYSHDSKGTYEEILAAAKAAKVDFVCMTDHPPKGDPGKSLREGWTGIHDGVLFIQGAEYSDQILALGIKEPIQFKDRRGTIRAIHEQGGVAIACHPEEIQDWSEYEEADGMEIYNVHAALKRHQKDPAFMAAALKRLKEGPERSFELLHELDPAILAKWDEINRTRRFTGIAGNDSHQNVNVFGLQLDPYSRAFKFVTTHVLAEDLNERAILGALKGGRSYVCFEILGNLKHFDLDWYDPKFVLTADPTPLGAEAMLGPLRKGHSPDRVSVSLTWDLPGAAYVVRVFPDPVRDPDTSMDQYVSRSVESFDVWARRNYWLTDVGVFRFVIRKDRSASAPPWILTNPLRIARTP